MDNLPPDDEDLLRFTEQQKANLDHISKGLVAFFAKINGQTLPEGASGNEAYDDHAMRELYRLSKSWDRLGKRKKQMDTEGLWNRLLDACYNAELELLKQQGIPEKSAKKLVRRELAWWEPDTRQFETGLDTPEACSSVPVVVVQREAGFRIHNEILDHLCVHPVFTEDVGGAKTSSPMEVFTNTLGSAEAIAEEYSFNDWEYIPSPGEVDGPDGLALACIMASLELRSMLGPIVTGGSVFLENEAPTHGEELAWLDKAKKGTQLWKLLNAAVELGQSLNHYSTFRDSTIEEAIRRMCTDGRPTTAPGEAVERIIRAARKDGLDRPTPKQLLKWLEGKKDPLSDAKPLVVKHQLWGEELAGISWEGFKNLVKSANRRSASTKSEQG